jgi:transcription elongation factor Elf1
MAKRRKQVEVKRWRVECPRCDKQIPAAVEKHARKAVINFECHNCGLSGDYVITGQDARRFLKG